MMWTDLIGKTVVGTWPGRYDSDIELQFSDGTAVLIEGHSYEEVDLSVRALTEIESLERRLDSVENALTRWIAEQKQYAEQQRRAQMRADLIAEFGEAKGEKAFQDWLRNRMGDFAYVLKQVYEPAIREQLNRQVFGSLLDKSTD
jgi:hypothetical protein